MTQSELEHVIKLSAMAELYLYRVKITTLTGESTKVSL